MNLLKNDAHELLFLQPFLRSNMIPISIYDEVAPLEALVVGTAHSFGGTPSLEDTHDPKSREHIRNGTFPIENDLIDEMQFLCDALKKYDVQVLRPDVIDNYNQIFARDISFAIEDKFIVPAVTHNRKKESDGIQYIMDQVEPSKLLLPDLHIRMEGGDIMPWNGKIYVGYSKEEDFNKYVVARTNEAGVEFLVNTFKDWEIVPIELKKSDDNPRENALHLDCCFQPLGKGKAIIHENGFKNPEDATSLINEFGKENIHFIDKDEMYDMHSNVFSVSPGVIISDPTFSRLNIQLRSWGFTVEEVAYGEVSKMEGLFRCTTMPLRRRYE